MTSLVLVNVAGEYKPGRVMATVTDLVAPAPGLAIRVDRTYGSLDRSRPWLRFRTTSVSSNIHAGLSDAYAVADRVCERLTP